MLLEKERKEIVDYGKQMSAAELTKGTAGNISIYDLETGYMAISPSGIGYYETKPEDIVIMTLDGKIVDGNRRPSSEYDLHATIYKVKPAAGAVVHTHSKYCTALACMRESLKAFHYVIASAGAGEIPCAEYATFGTEALAENVKKAIGNSNAVLLANHGLVTSGMNLAKAFKLAVSCEFCAEMQWMCECVGENKGVVLTGQEVADVMERFKMYGQVEKPSRAGDGGY